MSLFKKLWGKKDEKNPVRNQNDQPSVDCLITGDIIAFGLHDVPALCMQKAKILKTCSVHDGTAWKPQFLMEGRDQKRFYMTYESDDDGDHITLSMRLSEADIESYLNLDDLARVLGEGSGDILRLNQEAQKLFGDIVLNDHAFWVSQFIGNNEYRESIDAAPYIFADTDMRLHKESHAQGDHASKEYFDYYYLYGTEDDRHFIEIEVYEDGRTEIYAGVYQETHIIEQIFPSFEKTINE